MASDPMVLCGKDPATCDGFIRGILPKYDGKSSIISSLCIVAYASNSRPRLP